MYLSELHVKISNNSGNDAQSFDKVNEDLTKNSTTIFKSEIVVLKYVHTQASTLDVRPIFVKAHEEYRSLVTTDSWTNYMSEEHNHRTNLHIVPKYLTLLY